MKYTIKSRKEFLALKKKGKKLFSQNYICNVAASQHFSYGMIVTRKVGNAVLRNRHKRLIRHILTQLFQESWREKGFPRASFLFIVKQEATLDYHCMKKEIEQFLLEASKFNLVNSYQGNDYVGE